MPASSLIVSDLSALSCPVLTITGTGWQIAALFVEAGSRPRTYTNDVNTTSLDVMRDKLASAVYWAGAATDERRADVLDRINAWLRSDLFSSLD
jgi:hypothetical protein